MNIIHEAKKMVFSFVFQCFLLDVGNFLQNNVSRRDMIVK